VDGDKDGVVDLFTLPDAVASASNYLDVHNWSPLLRDQRKALYAYNRGAYADAVLSYATRIATD
jgi:membrane-bound lytic murein transglycosylase B